MDQKKTLLLIDSFALIFRAYYAFPPTLCSPKGDPTNAVYGFFVLLLDVLLKFKPNNVVAIFDSEGPTIRKTENHFYKANRKESDEILLAQIPVVKKLIETMDIPVLSVSGYEADDVIGAIDKRYSGKWAKTIIVTGDQDLFQLVDEDTFVYLAGRKFFQSKLYDSDKVLEKLGVRPNQIVSYKALKGDSSDNIPGVKGIGSKTAIDLLSRFNSLSGVYKNIEKINSKVKEKLVLGYEEAMVSEKLAKIDKSVPLSFDFEDSAFVLKNYENLARFSSELGFNSLIPKIEKLNREFGIKKEEQVGLFEVKKNKIQSFKIQTTENPDNLLRGMSELILVVGWGESFFSPEQIIIMKDGFFYNLKIDLLKKIVSGIYGDMEIVSLEVKKLFLYFLRENVAFDYKKFHDLGLWLIESMHGEVSYSLNLFASVLGGSTGDGLEASVGIIKSVLNKMASLKTNRNVLLERDVMYLTALMQHHGISIDENKLKDIEQKVSNKISDLEKKIFKLSKIKFNLNSPKQVSDILRSYGLLKDTQKTRGGQYSTSKKILSRFSSENLLVQKILEYREVDKLHKTYVLPLGVFVDNNKIHASFDQFGAVTGRFSSKKPNMQNIPKGETIGINLREIFIPEKGNIFLGFDYSQQELRILAVLAEEENLVQSFKEGGDAHVLTASKIFKKKLSEVTPEERNIGKTVNFSVIYGVSPFGLAERLKISQKEAYFFVSNFYKEYPKIKDFIEKTLKKVKKSGYAETCLLRRRRKAAFLGSSNFSLKKSTEREMFNFVIQGTAAEVMKLCMQNFIPILRKYKAKLLLQIHDEFLFEIKDNNKNSLDFAREIYNTMINVKELEVPYQVEVSKGYNWGGMEKIIL